LLNYIRLSRKPEFFRCLTGLELFEIDLIYKEIESRYLQYEIKRLCKRNHRTRRVGAGNHFELKVRERFLVLLVCYRFAITNTSSQFLFDPDQSNVFGDIRHIHRIISQYSMTMPFTTMNIK